MQVRKQLNRLFSVELWMHEEGAFLSNVCPGDIWEGILIATATNDATLETPFSADVLLYIFDFNG